VPRPQTFVTVPVGAQVPPVYRWLAQQPADAVVAEIPALGPDGFASFEYMYLSTFHWRRLVNGTSGFEPAAARVIARELDRFPDPTAVLNLQSVGVRYVIAHGDKLDAPARQRLDEAHLGDRRLRVAATFGSDVVFEIEHLTARPAFADHVSVELPSVVGRDTTPFFAIDITNDSPLAMYVGPPQALGARVEWVGDGAQQLPRQAVPVFFEPYQRVRLLFPAELTRTAHHADSAELKVNVTGAYELEASQSVRIRDDLATSLQRRGLAATIEQVHLPPRVQANAVVPVDVLARNIGDAIWLAGPTAGDAQMGAVGISIRGWLGPAGDLLPASLNSTAHIQGNVGPGQAALVTIHTRAPAAPGRYQLVLDLLSENVTWFEDVNGGARTTVPVLVAAEPE
jgi:hypothetical protein